MRRALKYLMLLIAFLSIGHAQNRKIDSLKRVLKQPLADTTRINTLNRLGIQLRRAGEIDSAMKIASQIRDLSLATRNKKGLALAFTLFGRCYSDNGDYANTLTNYFRALKLHVETRNVKSMGDLMDNIASIYNYQGNYRRAISFYEVSLQISRILHDKDGMALTYNNLASVYQSMGNYPDALTNTLAALKIREEQGNKRGMAITLTNLGNVHYGQGDYKQALEDYVKALRLSREINDSYGLSLCYNNIGATYTEMGNYEEALKNHFASLRVKKGQDKESGVASSYVNIGLAYAYLNDYPRAFKYYNEALIIQEKLGDREGIALLCNNIGNLYLDQKKISESRKYLEKGLKFSLAAGSKTDIMASYGHLAALDSLTGNYKAALENYKLHILYRDSMANEENTKKTVQAEMQYSFDKKESAAKLEQEKKDVLMAADARRRTLVLAAVSVFGLLVLGFAVFAWRSFLQKKKANAEISLQKHLIEEKQKEILDSIYYARRIQRSLLPNEKIIEKYLRKSG